MELEVEKVAKKKLVASSLVLISLLAKVLKGSRLKKALALWKSHTRNTQVAETAFNELLEINHKHTTARYFTAFSILQRTCRRTIMEEFFEAFERIKVT